MMRPFTSTISLDDARRRLRESVTPIARTEHVRLADAAGRVAAGDVISPMDVPPFARSAMDGYAVVAADTSGARVATPVRLSLVERIYTGQVPTRAIERGTCAEIATGAPIPRGADAVVMVEQTARLETGLVREATRSGGEIGETAGQIEIRAPVRPGQHVNPRGADIQAGSAVISAGNVLAPARVGALAAIGQAGVDVYARPRVALVSTGNEVIEPGQPLQPGQIFDVNRFTLAAIVAAHGGAPEEHQAVEDDVRALAAALDRCTGADLIVLSGGSSVGERDLLRDVVGGRGELIFHGIAIKPGKPTAFGRIAGVPFFGMPGNPTSCLSNAYVLLIPFLRALARLPPFVPRTTRAHLAKRIGSGAGRHQFYTVRLENGAAWPAFKGSGDITSLSQADGYVEIPADREGFDEGSEVEVVLF